MGKIRRSKIKASRYVPHRRSSNKPLSDIQKEEENESNIVLDAEVDFDDEKISELKTVSGIKQIRNKVIIIAIKFHNLY